MNNNKVCKYHADSFNEVNDWVEDERFPIEAIDPPETTLSFNKVWTFTSGASSNGSSFFSFFLPSNNIFSNFAKGI